MGENTAGLEQKLRARDVARGTGRLMATPIKNFRKHPIKATLKILFVGAIGAGMYFSNQSARAEDYDRQLTREVGILADTNKDIATTSEEWANVYKELGVRYDAFSSNPVKDFTTEQKESYIKNHN